MVRAVQLCTVASLVAPLPFTCLSTRQMHRYRHLTTTTSNMFSAETQSAAAAHVLTLCSSRTHPLMRYGTAWKKDATAELVTTAL
jgi:hypothetical protein